MNIQNTNRERILLGAILLCFATIYSLISLVNHYCFRTYALDLGMFNQAIYNFSHFKMDYFSLNLIGSELNYFGDHFSPITVVISPLYYLFGSYTLLILQIIAILFGGVGIYKYASLSSANSRLPLFIILQFFGIWGIYSALSFDYHNNVLGAMFVPWLLYFYERGNKKAFFLFFALLLFTKENMALWAAFIMIGLLVKQWAVLRGKMEWKKALKFEIPLIVGAFLYFIVIIGVVMPFINHGAGTNQLNRYSHLGGSLTEIMSTILQNPRYLFSLLFESPLKDELTFGIKSEFHFMVFVSGGFALFYRPWYLVMLLPIYGQKLLTNDYGFWGINGHYSIEFAPILSICLSDFLLKMKPAKLAYSLAILTAFTTWFYTYKTLESRKSMWYDKINSAFYLSDHYKSPLNIPAVNRALKSVPETATISVSTAIAPHVSRDNLYQFPIVKDAEYIVLFTSNSSTYPLSQEDFDAQVQDYLNNELYTVQYHKYDLLILKRKTAN